MMTISAQLMCAPFRIITIPISVFLFPAMGPILPFTIVFGKQLGISEIVMGTFLAVLPMLFLVAKPAFGYLADYFQVIVDFLRI